MLGTVRERLRVLGTGSNRRRGTSTFVGLLGPWPAYVVVRTRPQRQRVRRLGWQHVPKRLRRRVLPSLWVEGATFRAALAWLGLMRPVGNARWKPCLRCGRLTTARHGHCASCRRTEPALRRGPLPALPSRHREVVARTARLHARRAGWHEEP